MDNLIIDHVVTVVVGHLVTPKVQKYKITESRKLKFLNIEFSLLGYQNSILWL